MNKTSCFRFAPVTSSLNTINHSYWSYWHQLSNYMVLVRYLSVPFLPLRDFQPPLQSGQVTQVSKVTLWFSPRFLRFREGWWAKGWSIQWTDLRENLNRKPAIFPWRSWVFPVNCPLNQSIDQYFRSPAGSAFRTLSGSDFVKKKSTKHGFKQINHDHDFKVHAELLMFIQRLYAPASWCFSASQAMEIGYKKSLGISSN